MKDAAIVEDERPAAELLKEFLVRFGKERGEEFKFSYFSDAADFFTHFKGNYDIVFMDIELPGMDGLRAAQKLREMDENILLIFVTNMAQFAVGGYEVGAFDFIVKPVSYANFTLKMDRAMRKMKNNEGGCVWVNTRQSTRRIFISDIKYVEVINHCIIYHTKEGDITTTGTMKSVIETLKNNSFAQCNQSYFINLRYVDGFSAASVVVDGNELTISRPKKKEFLRALNLYLNSH